MKVMKLLLGTGAVTIGLAFGTALVIKHIIDNKEETAEIKNKAADFGKSTVELGKEVGHAVADATVDIGKKATVIKDELMEKFAKDSKSAEEDTENSENSENTENSENSEDETQEEKEQTEDIEEDNEETE